MTAVLICLAAWGAASAALRPMLRRDYAAGAVRAGTGMLIWTWHALNYGLLILFSVEGLWAMGLSGPVRALGLALIAFGACLVAAGFYEFRSVGRLTGMRRTDLIDSGVYRFSRHPQYLGIISTLLGGALAGDSGAALAFATLLAAGLLLYLPLEERYVSQAFGHDYARYRQRVPMLLGLPRRRR